MLGDRPHIFSKGYVDMICKNDRAKEKVHIKLLALVSVIVVMFFTANFYTYACTIFTKEQDGKVLVGNNEDYLYHINSSMTVKAADKDSYGMVFFSNSSYVQGGMNEKGLFYDGAACPSTNVPYSKGKQILGMNFGEEVLSKCSNVDEAVDFLKKYNIPKSFGDHLLLADATGKSAIVEWVQDEMRIIPKEKDYQVVTNFFISNPELGGYPCNRYETAEAMLKGFDRISLANFKDVLSNVKQDWGDGGTKYSNIYDLRNKIVYVFNKADFGSAASINLSIELGKLKHGEKENYKIEELYYEKFEDNSFNPVVDSSRIGDANDESSANSEVKNKIKSDQTETNLKNKNELYKNTTENDSALILWGAILGILVVGGVIIFLLKHKSKHTIKSE